MTKLNESDVLDMTIRIMDKLADMKVLNKEQSADLDFSIQDAIAEEIKVILIKKMHNLGDF